MSLGVKLIDLGWAIKAIWQKNIDSTIFGNIHPKFECHLEGVFIVV